MTPEFSKEILDDLQEIGKRISALLISKPPKTDVLLDIDKVAAFMYGRACLTVDRIVGIDRGKTAQEAWDSMVSPYHMLWWILRSTHGTPEYQSALRIYHKLYRNGESKEICDEIRQHYPNPPMSKLEGG